MQIVLMTALFLAGMGRMEVGVAFLAHDNNYPQGQTRGCSGLVLCNYLKVLLTLCAKKQIIVRRIKMSLRFLSKNFLFLSFLKRLLMP